MLELNPKKDLVEVITICTCTWYQVIEPLLERTLCTLVALGHTFTHPGQQGHVATFAVIGARGRPHLARTYFLRELSGVRTDATKAKFLRFDINFQLCSRGLYLVTIVLSLFVEGCAEIDVTFFMLCYMLHLPQHDRHHGLAGVGEREDFDPLHHFALDLVVTLEVDIVPRYPFLVPKVRLHAGKHHQYRRHHCYIGQLRQHALKKVPSFPPRAPVIVPIFHPRPTWLVTTLYIGTFQYVLPSLF